MCAVATHWVDPANATGGLDHIGSQQPCIDLYGQLLPGLTNVTDRIRYYSFYPWLLKAIDQRYRNLTVSQLIDLLRKSECLFALAALRHSQLHTPTEPHRIGLVGYNTLQPASEELLQGGEVVLSKHATRDENAPERYFKNKYGGLGQYYWATLSGLGILDSDASTGPRFRGLGGNLADAFGVVVSSDAFFKSLERDRLTATQLDQLSGFCPCQLAQNAPERDLLLDLFFSLSTDHGLEGRKRRASLGLMLAIADCLSKQIPPVALTENLFRAGTYTSSLPSGDPLPIASTFADAAKGWRTYETNELVSLAFQAIFWVILDRLRLDGGRIGGLPELRRWFREQVVAPSFSSLSDISFDAYLAGRRSQLPDLRDWEDPSHEIYHAEAILKHVAQRNSGLVHSDVLGSAFAILANLALRDSGDVDPYAGFVHRPEYFDYYRIQLRSFYSNVRGDWRTSPLADLVVELAVDWCVENHLMVALRKLRYQSDDTFRIRPTEEGFVLRAELPPPVFTNPRFRQAKQALQDLGLININQPGLTALGHDVLAKLG